MIKTSKTERYATLLNDVTEKHVDGKRISCSLIMFSRYFRHFRGRDPKIDYSQAVNYNEAVKDIEKQPGKWKMA